MQYQIRFKERSIFFLSLSNYANDFLSNFNPAQIDRRIREAFGWKFVFCNIFDLYISRVKFFTKIYEPFEVGSVYIVERQGCEEMLLDNRMPCLGIILILNRGRYRAGRGERLICFIISNDRFHRHRLIGRLPSVVSCIERNISVYQREY